MEVTLLVAITFAFFCCGMVTMVTGARLVYAMSRDSRFPAHRLMRRVSPRTQTPVPATILMLAGGIMLMLALPGGALFLRLLSRQ
jgi:amino acid transporter